VKDFVRGVVDILDFVREVLSSEGTFKQKPERSKSVKILIHRWGAGQTG
jgi:hypothetical protein